jgi:hypothetical protein
LGPREAPLLLTSIGTLPPLLCSPDTTHLSIDHPSHPGRDCTSVTELSPWLKPRPSVHDALTSSRAARIAASTERLLGKFTPIASTHSPPGPLVPTGSTHPKPLHYRGQAPYPSSDGVPEHTSAPKPLPPLGQAPYPSSDGVPERTSAPKPLPPLGQAPYPSSDGVSERTSAPKPLPPLGQAPYPLSDGVPECSLHTPYPLSDGVPVPASDLVLPPLPTTGIPPLVLLHHLEQALSWNVPPLLPTAFQFQWTASAAQHNLEILAAFDYDLGRAIAAQPGTIVTPGCEFRPTSLLRPLCGHHPLWPRASEWLTSGVVFPTLPISEDDRLVDLRAMLARGNHQSAKLQAPRLEKMMQVEVQHGWQLPLPPDAALLIPGAIIAPMGLVKQATITEQGEIVEKFRVTHDQSFNPVKRTQRSVNNRVQHDLLTPCMFGRALLRHVHQIVALRHRYPNESILQSKVDVKSAYRRLHNAIATAVAAMVLVGAYLLVALRLTFGGSPNPSRWSDLSEIACDLANDLAHNPGWDPAVHFSPHSERLPPDPILEPPSIPFATAVPLSVDLPVDDEPKTEVYIDDLFNCYLLRHLVKGGRILPFVLHLLGRPTHTEDPITRDDILSITKFLAEATPSEVKTILGWEVDTRRLLLSLPADKVAAWSESIQIMLRSPTKVSYEDLDTLIGRLNHCGFLIPQARHFLGRIRTAKHKASKRRQAHLSPAVQADLSLWLSFLAAAGQGIDMNLLTFRHPTHVSRADACEHGLGGYSLVTGKAWRFEIPIHLRLRTSLNSLEHLATYIQLAFEASTSPGLPPQSVILTGTDSTTAAGWLHHSSFDDSTPDSPSLRLLVARATAQLLLDQSSVLFPKWFAGKENQVADSLSRDHHLANDVLFSLLCSSFPSQIPKGFEICPLPRKLYSQIMTWLHKLPPSLQSPKVPTRSGIDTSPTTAPSSNGWSSTMTHSSTPSCLSAAPVSLVPSPMLTATEDFPLLRALIHEHQELVETPSTLWLRPIGLTSVAAPATTPVGNSQNFYQTS